MLEEKNWLKKKYVSLQNKRLKKFELTSFNNCNAIIPITDIDAKNLKLLFPSMQIETCLTGLNLEDYKRVLLPMQPNTIFHFASMDWMPNIEAVNWLLENVWNDVIKEIPYAKLVIAGRGMPESIKQKVSSSISIIEQVESSVEFYKTFDIMLVPLWSGSGLRIKLVEGLAYGKAIITTGIGAEGIPYVANKHLMIADSCKDFKNAIITFIKNQSLKLDLQNEARALAESKFNYKIIAEKLIVFYQRLLKS